MEYHIHSEELTKHLHTKVREKVEYFKQFDGAEFPKKLLRYNDMVESCKRYFLCGDSRTITESKIESVVEEVVRGCLKGDCMFTGRSSLEIVPDWMINPDLKDTEEE